MLKTLFEQLVGTLEWNKTNLGRGRYLYKNMKCTFYIEVTTYFPYTPEQIEMLINLEVVKIIAMKIQECGQIIVG